jgi:hypothetical protein
MDRQALIEYIREAAIARGMDPDIAVRVAASEGLYANPEEGWQSQIVDEEGRREESYGPFQLYMGGGLGNVFMERTGLDPRDPSTVTQQIDFALDEAKRGGWGPWYGAARVGIGERDGLGEDAPVSADRRLPSEELASGEYFDMFGDRYATPEARAAADQQLASESLAANKQVAREGFLDNLSDALAYLDLSQLAGGAKPPKMSAPGIYRPQGGSGARALKRMGLASLV